MARMNIILIRNLLEYLTVIKWTLALEVRILLVL